MTKERRSDVGQRIRRKVYGPITPFSNQRKRERENKRI